MKLDAVKTRVLAALRDAHDGLNLLELQRKSGLSRLSSQQFRRRLQALIASGEISATGKTRAKRYTLAAREEARPESHHFAWSAGAQEVRARVSSPVTARKPVGYRREFLDRYEPNRTFYLAAPVRAQLAEISRTPEQGQPAGTYARQIFNRLLIDLSWNSSRLEGNTYSLLDTERLIAAGQEAEGQDRRDTQMIINHKAAIEFLVNGAAELTIDERTVRNLHAQLTDNLLQSQLDAGRLRISPVGITDSVFEPLANPQLITECFRQLVLTAEAIVDPFEQSLFLLVHLPYLQPFIDGNKRTARLAANLPFVKKNLIPLSFVDVARDDFTLAVLGVYELNRVEPLAELFTFAYRRSASRYHAIRASMGEPDPFRLQHRDALRAFISTTIRERLDRGAALTRLAAFAAENVPEPAQLKFRALAETELDSLNEGNFARYSVRPSEFDAWRAQWSSTL